MEPILFVLYVLFWALLACLCTSVAYHRGAHGSVSLHWSVRNLMFLAVKGRIGLDFANYAAMHLAHHRDPDGNLDPHSPRMKGKWSIVFLMPLHYHRFIRNPANLKFYPRMRKLELVDYLPLVGWYGMGGLVIDVYVWGGKLGLLSWTLSALIYIFIQSVTNGLTHSEGFGEAPFPNTGRNIRWLAYLTFGDALQNNHHQFENSPCFAMNPGEKDLGWDVIQFLERMRLAESNPLAHIGISAKAAE